MVFNKTLPYKWAYSQEPVGMIFYNIAPQVDVLEIFKLKILF
jgi:hypothetical protein